jgi:hypothetical protein
MSASPRTPVLPTVEVAAQHLTKLPLQLLDLSDRPRIRRARGCPFGENLPGAMTVQLTPLRFFELPNPVGQPQEKRTDLAANRPVLHRISVKVSELLRHLRPVVLKRRPHLDLDLTREPTSDLGVDDNLAIFRPSGFFTCGSRLGQRP